MVSARTAFGLALLLGAVAGPAPAAPGPVDRGEAIARRVCAGCHAIEAGGESPSPRAPGLATREMRHTAGLEGRVAALTRAGHYGMPPLDLSDRDVADVVAYIQSLKPAGDSGA